ncbi:hypothetical protein ACOXXX_15490 [Thalassococcus sp. BH17M4-6]|uniref:hypothetical protein n=1 Tax=Thalassococcus sp. BH17M4-6 TaxID=3413148 RepID=UPI003BC22DF5
MSDIPDLSSCKATDALLGFQELSCGEGGRFYRADWLGVTWTEAMFMWQILVWVIALWLSANVLRDLWRYGFMDRHVVVAGLLWLVCVPIVLAIVLAGLNLPYGLARHGLRLGHEASVGVCLAIWGMMLSWVLHKASNRR